MCVLLHLWVCTELRAHVIVVEALYKIKLLLLLLLLCTTCHPKPEWVSEWFWVPRVLWPVTWSLWYLSFQACSWRARWSLTWRTPTGHASPCRSCARCWWNATSSRRVWWRWRMSWTITAHGEHFCIVVSCSLWCSFSRRRMICSVCCLFC